jgi:hypothetical protein
MCIIHIIIIGDDQIISDHLEKCDYAVEITTHDTPTSHINDSSSPTRSLPDHQRAPRPPTQTAENKKIKNSATTAEIEDDDKPP